MKNRPVIEMLRTLPDSDSVPRRPGMSSEKKTRIEPDVPRAHGTEDVALPAVEPMPANGIVPIAPGLRREFTVARSRSALASLLVSIMRKQLAQARFGDGDEELRNALLQLETVIIEQATNRPIIFARVDEEQKARDRILSAYRRMVSGKDVESSSLVDPVLLSLAQAEAVRVRMDEVRAKGRRGGEDATNGGEGARPKKFALRERLVGCTCVRETWPLDIPLVFGTDDDDMMLVGSFEYMGLKARLNRYFQKFYNDGDVDATLPQRPRRLAGVNIIEGPTLYTASHLMFEDDPLSVEGAELFAAFVVRILTLLLDLGLAALEAYLLGRLRSERDPGERERLETLLDAVRRAIAEESGSTDGQVAKGAISGALEQFVAEAFGPEPFEPFQILVNIDWPNATEDPVWTVEVTVGEEQVAGFPARKVGAGKVAVSGLLLKQIGGDERGEYQLDLEIEMEEVVED